jgi:hypothetical protein
VKPNESVTVMVKLKVPVAVGVPEMTPLDVLSVVPVGSAPEVTANVYGDVPPCAVIVSE